MFFDWLRRAPQRRPLCARKTPRQRLSFDALEDRLVPAPATFVVTTPLDVVDPADGKLSLREAITKANDHAGADTIVLPGGVFKITPGAFEDGNLNGDFDITDGVTIQGAGAGKAFIDGQQFDRVFDIRGAAPSSIRVVLQGLTIRNGFVILDGGGIHVGNADLVVRDCVVSGNRAFQTGGGISNAAAPGTGNVAIIRTTVVRNSSNGNGAGINVTGNSTLTLKDSTVRRNIAGNEGGGIAANTVNVTGSAVSGNNSGSRGGGIRAATANVTNSSVSGNNAKNQGGGIDAFTANVTNSTISSNNAAEGGGISSGMATVTGSTVSGNNSGSIGGGIRATTANVTNSSVSGNNAKNQGGGIDAFTANVTNSTVSGNSAGGSDSGGGVFATTANVNNSTVSGNNAGINGGGIRAATANVSNSSVSGNNAAEGGGISATTANVTNTTVGGNNAADGGGISATTANVTNSTVSGNNAGSRGGGINALTATVTNSTVSGNSAKTEGGGIWATTAALLNVTVVENIAQTGGGVFHNPGGTFSVRNTLIALNLFSDVSGDFTSGGHNLIGDGTGTGFTNGVNGDIVGTAANPIDPKLGALSNNGGRTKTHALLAGSPAIDAGDNSLVPATDQRGTGFQRVKDGNGDRQVIADIGAFER